MKIETYPSKLLEWQYDDHNAITSGYANFSK